MKSTRRAFFVASTLAFAISLFSFMPTPAHASDMRGTITLPTEASWNGTLLPAGNYEYSLQYSGSSTVVMLRNLQTTAGAIFMANSVSDVAAMSKPSLVLTREGNSMFVTSLNVGEVSLGFHAATPKTIAHMKMASASQ